MRRVRPMRVGLTGGVASGKSTVAALLTDLGAVVVDADTLAREVVAPGTPGLAGVVAEFGPEVLDADGALDRAALGRLVFEDPARRAALEAIIHPLVRARAERQVGQMPDATPEEALAFYTKRYDDLAFEVQLLEQRIAAGTLARRGDLGGGPGARDARRRPGGRRPGGPRWTPGWGKLRGTIDKQREAAQGRPRPSGQRRRSPARTRSPRRRRPSPRAPTGATAPTGCASSSKRSGRRCRGIDKSTDDTLWRRFSFGPYHLHPTAQGPLRRARREARGRPRRSRRSSSSRPRQYGRLHRVGPDGRAGYRELMRQWKAAGPAPEERRRPALEALPGGPGPVLRCP